MFDVQICYFLLRFNSLQAYLVQGLARCLTNVSPSYWKILEDTWPVLPEIARFIACFLCPSVLITSVPKATLGNAQGDTQGDTESDRMFEYDQ